MIEIVFVKGHKINLGRKRFDLSKKFNGSGNPFYGKKHSEKTKKINSEKHLGKSTWNKGIKIDRNKYPQYGHFKKHSERTIEKISKSRTGIKSHRKGKNFKEEYGLERTNKIKQKIKERRAKQIFPIKDSSIEVKIQEYLKLLGIDFFTHQYINIKHGYQCDILIPSFNMVIECDGDYWHKYPIGRDIDNIRTKELIEKGFKILRLWENEIRVMSLNEFKKKIGME